MPPWSLRAESIDSTLIRGLCERLPSMVVTAAEGLVGTGFARFPASLHAEAPTVTTHKRAAARDPMVFRKRAVVMPWII